jgi:hypothetical protein
VTWRALLSILTAPAVISLTLLASACGTPHAQSKVLKVETTPGYTVKRWGNHCECELTVTIHPSTYIEVQP